jgi:hypothetical protein
MTAARQLTADQVRELPPVISLVQLSQALGVSEPVVRAALRRGELTALGIKVNKVGAQHRVITASLLEYLGISRVDRASAESTGCGGEGHRDPTASALRLAEAPNGTPTARGRPLARADPEVTGSQTPAIGT